MVATVSDSFLEEEKWSYAPWSAVFCIIATCITKAKHCTWNSKKL